MKPFISIIMPVYNNEKYLPSAVKSIIGQTFSDWELIIIDDGSTDRTPEIADRLAERDKRIRVIHQENQWIFKSFNNGYAAALGEYVLIVNSDDTIGAESLERIHRAASADNADIVLFNLSINKCDQEQKVTAADIYHRKNALAQDFSLRGAGQVHAMWPEFMRKKLVGHQCVYKSSIAKSIKYRTDVYAADVFYNIQFADFVKAAAGTSYCVYNYFIYDNDGMNASVGKFYGYEHDMFNDLYTAQRDLFQRWGILSAENEDALSAERLNNLTNEIKSYLSPMCSMDIDRKIQSVFENASDRIIYECAARSGRTEEYESRILSGLRELMTAEIPSVHSPYYFVYELLDALLRYEKNDEDMKKIRTAVNHSKNPNSIGSSFYKKLLQCESKI